MRSSRRIQYVSGTGMIQVVPFVTVTFLLVLFAVFFLLLEPGGIRLSKAMPDSAGPGTILEITVNEMGLRLIHGREVTDPQLASLLAALSFRDPPVMIKASKKAPLESFLGVWRMCGKAGLSKVSLITD